MVRIVRIAFAGVAWLFLACVIAQVFLAGVAVFGDGDFATHREFGYLFGLLTLVLVILAIAGRMGRRWIGASALLLVLFALQSVFVLLRTSAATLAALHAVNALAIFWVAQGVARGSLAQITAAMPSPAPPPPSEPEPVQAAE
jgi:hypothetical protein